MTTRNPLLRAIPVLWPALAIGFVGIASTASAQAPPEFARWLQPQQWVRDVNGPILELGKHGDFDDTHIFAPHVAIDDGRFLLWYCGSTGFAHDLAPMRTADERVFQLGLATSTNGMQFEKSPAGPVFKHPEDRMSILTPTILRHSDGSVLRENGKMRMWFSSARLGGGGRAQAIQESTSIDGIHWSPPSPVQIERAYAPSVIKTDRGYEMWYTEPGRYPWRIRHARSDDGSQWSVDEQLVLEVSQDWEHFLQIYPSVTRIDEVYLMWYASYLHENRETTAIGFAVSLDGVRWTKHPQNPVLGPDPSRDWESHYVSSQSVVRLADGSFRMWYASRKKPPFHNLYFAINTVRWMPNP